VITSALVFATLYTVFVWWFSTGAILWLGRRPRATHSWSLAGATLVAGVCVLGILSGLDRADPAGAIVAFTCAVGLWGWHEMAFLMGFVTGSRTTPCPPSAQGWRRFRLAAATLMRHELALFATVVALGASSLGHGNRIAFLTFLALWVSRLSAKLNLFCGVPNFSEEFFPGRLHYLTTYLRKSPPSLLFPVSLALGILAMVLASRAVWDPQSTAFMRTGGSLLLVLVALALAEHGFMVTPLPDTLLWRWALPGGGKSATPHSLDVGL
jgi:putative photosynthetic complex assembly protein 2